jgi:F0F1-type ATP synthase membrane subunit b/b'
VLTILADTDWLNYPGFEAWRFVNLFLFIAGALYVHYRFGKPVSEKLRNRRANIKRELEEAQRHRELAEAQLVEVETRLKSLDDQVSKIRADAEAEAKAERDRIKEATEMEIAKLRAHGDREIEKIAKNAQLELRQFTANQSIRKAETLIRRDIDLQADSRLISTSATQFRGRQI